MDFPQYASLGSEQEGKRPVVVMSANAVNAALPICMVVPLSSKVEKGPRHFRIFIPESQKIPEAGTKGCPGDSVALTEQTRCISIERFLDQKRVARLKIEAIGAIEAGIRYVLGMP